MAGLSTISAGLAFGFIKAGEVLTAGDLVILNNLGLWVRSSNRGDIGIYGIVDNHSGFKLKTNTNKPVKVRLFGAITASIETTTQSYSTQSNVVTAGINGKVEINGTGQPVGFLTKGVSIGDTQVTMVIMNGIAIQTIGTLTPTEIKALYESNPDTNDFNDAAENKLSGIETSATRDQNAAEVPSDAITGVTGTDVQTVLESLNSKIENITSFGGFQGTYDVQNDTIPSRASGTIEAGDYWRVVNAGATGRPFGSDTVLNGDIVFANVAGADKVSDFTVINQNRAADLQALISRIVTIETKLATIATGAEVNDNAETIKTKLFSNSDTNNLDDALLGKLNDIPNNSSANNGDFIRIGATNYQTITLADLVALVNAKSADFPPHNETDRAPIVSDDTDAGYEVTSLWIDTLNNDAYIAFDVTAGAAVWRRITVDAAEVKALYEENANTNAYTDKEKAELLAIPKPSGDNKDKLIFIQEDGYRVITIAELEAQFTKFRYQFEYRGTPLLSNPITKINFTGGGVFVKTCGNLLTVDIPGGGGGAGGGHIYQNSDGVAVPNRTFLKLQPGARFTDDADDDATLLEIDGVELPQITFTEEDWELQSGDQILVIQHNLGTSDIDVSWYENGLDGTVDVPWDSPDDNQIRACIAGAPFNGLVRITARAGTGSGNNVVVGSGIDNIVTSNFQVSVDNDGDVITTDNPIRIDFNDVLDPPEFKGRRVSFDSGDFSSGSLTITHNLGKQSIIARFETGNIVSALDYEIIDNNNIKITTTAFTGVAIVIGF